MVNIFKLLACIDFERDNIVFGVNQRKSDVIECSHTVPIQQEIEAIPCMVAGIISVLRSCSKDLEHNLLTRSVFITCITQVESQASFSVEEPEEIKTNDDAMLTGWEENVGEHGRENASHLGHINVGRNNPFYLKQLILDLMGST